MSKLIGALSALFLSLCLSATANATIVSMNGDDDCFGLGGACPDGSLYVDDLGGVFFADNSDPGDPEFTDVWDSFGEVSYEHTIDLAGVVVSAAEFTIRIAGIADIGGPYDVFLNGALTGQIPVNDNANAFQETLTTTISLSLAALIDGLNTITIVTGGGDGFIVDFSTITIDTAEVPIPGAALLLLTGLAGVGFSRRRKTA